MTENEWLASADPRAMLTSFQVGAWEPWPFSCVCLLTDCRQRGGLCPCYRKLRVFCCAVCRRVLHMLPDPVCQTALEAAERYADGEVDRKAYLSASGKFDTVRRSRFPKHSTPDDDAWNALYCAVHRRWDGYTDGFFALKRWELASAVVRDAVAAVGPDEARPLACLLREVVGNPFRTVPVPPAWRTPNVVSLAQAAYQERALPCGELDAERLAVLSDALEDAGCTVPDILTHLRSSGPHVRGCWALDLLRPNCR